MRSMVLRQIAFFPASITGAGAFDTAEQRIVKCKSVVWVRERSERNLYEKAEKGKLQRFLRRKVFRYQVGRQQRSEE